MAMAVAPPAAVPMIRLVVGALLALAVATPRAARAQRDQPLLAADDPSAERWRLLGETLFAAHRHREAIAAFERAAQLGADAADASWRIARAYARYGNRRQALRWLAGAKARGFDVRAAISLEPAFDEYRGDPRFGALTDTVPRRRPVARSAFRPDHDRSAVVFATEDRVS
jgi:hypothetical protein